MTHEFQPKADEIVRRLSAGEPLAVICRDPGMPGVSTVQRWRVAHPDFDTAFLEARDSGFDVIAADCLSIVDNTNEDPASRRVRSDVRLKLLAKWDPRRYGERLDLSHSGSIQTQSEEQINARLTQLLGKAGVVGAAGGTDAPEGAEPAG